MNVQVAMSEFEGSPYGVSSDSRNRYKEKLSPPTHTYTYTNIVAKLQPQLSLDSLASKCGGTH